MAKIKIKIGGPWPAWCEDARTGELVRLDGTIERVLVRVGGEAAATLDGLDARRFSRALARIRDPGVLRLVHAHAANGRLVSIHEFFGGVSLATAARILKDEGRGLPVGVVLAVVSQVARTLASARGGAPDDEVRVTHPGVRPVDILVDAGGRLKLAGFVACRAEAPAPPAPEGYGAPEGGEAEPALGYALGALLVELLTAEPPAPASPDPKRHEATVRRARIRVLARPGEPVPPELVALVRRCLAHDPGERPVPLALADELDGFARELRGPGLRTWASGAIPGLVERLKGPAIIPVAPDPSATSPVPAAAPLPPADTQETPLVAPPAARSARPVEAATEPVKPVELPASTPAPGAPGPLGAAPGEGAPEERTVLVGSAGPATPAPVEPPEEPEERTVLIGTAAPVEAPPAAPPPEEPEERTVRLEPRVAEPGAEAPAGPSPGEEPEAPVSRVGVAVGESPDAVRLGRDAAPPTRTPWVLGAAALLVLVGGVAGLGWWFSHREPAAEVAPTAGAAREAAPADAPVPPAGEPEAPPEGVAGGEAAGAEAADAEAAPTAPAEGEEPAAPEAGAEPAGAEPAAAPEAKPTAAVKGTGRSGGSQTSASSRRSGGARSAKRGGSRKPAAPAAEEPVAPRIAPKEPAPTGTAPSDTEPAGTAAARSAEGGGSGTPTAAEAPGEVQVDEATGSSGSVAVASRPVAPERFRVEFQSADPAVERLVVHCHVGRGDGPPPVVIDEAGRGPCRVTGYRGTERLIVMVPVSGAHTFTCFEGGQRACR